MARVLVVDDEVAVRDVMCRWIAAAGHECVEAEHAADALEKNAATPADVAFVDIQMPGKDGIWLTRELRQQYPTLAVVLATGVSTVPPAVSMQAGVLAYLVKPMSRQDVAEALKTALDWHDETVKSGAKPADRGATLDAWLAQLE